jgi:hypothetical protein
MFTAASTLSLDSTLGSISIGYSVSCFVFGILTTQVFIYYRKYPSDRLQYQYLVSVTIIPKGGRCKNEIFHRLRSYGEEHRSSTNPRHAHGELGYSNWQVRYLSGTLCTFIRYRTPRQPFSPFIRTIG